MNAVLENDGSGYKITATDTVENKVTVKKYISAVGAMNALVRLNTLKGYAITANVNSAVAKPNLWVNAESWYVYDHGNNQGNFTNAFYMFSVNVKQNLKTLKGLLKSGAFEIHS